VTASTQGRDRVVVGVDIGGTFTDVAVRRPDAPPVIAKVLTTPDDPTKGFRAGVVEALTRAGVDGAAVARHVHATTLATNTIVEGRGARVVLVTTEGFGDLLELGRTARVEEDRYDLRFPPHSAPVAVDAVVEAPERMTASGVADRPLSDNDAADVAARVAAHHPEAVAVCLLHAWANPAHEEMLTRQLTRALPDAPIASSSVVWPELREYDRAMTTVLSASVAPVMSAYLTRLGNELAAAGIGGDLWIMDSAGGIASVDVTVRRPVITVESGGAAGLLAAAELARTIADGSAIAFDMGGTTAKAGIVREGRPDITYQFEVGGKGSFGVARAGTGLPVKGPVVDLAEVGAGGGSLAWVDPAGSLRVGPRSAGAVPGPAAYGRGGTEATVTDANVVLGLLPEGDLAGGIRISRDAAATAVEQHVASPLGLDIVDAAVAIREIAVAHMAAAIRVVTVQRGIDPREFPIVAFGGAGPMHATALADLFEIDDIVVPSGAGVAAALGLSSAAPAADRLQTQLLPATPAAAGDAVAILDKLAGDAADELAGYGASADLVVQRRVDMRVRGQAHHLTIDADELAAEPGLEAVLARFADEYERMYGIRPEGASELVTFRVRVTAPVERPEVTTAVVTEHPHEPVPPRRAHFGTAYGEHDTQVWDWERLPYGWATDGPAVIVGGGSTVVVPPSWTATLVDGGHLSLRRRTA
jgi:N-methylhydantoinase A